MEDHSILAAALASSRAGAERFLILVASGLILYAVLVAAVIRELHKWGRDMDKRAALREREHQERMIAFEMDARRRAEDHERFMRRLNARRR